MLRTALIVAVTAMPVAAQARELTGLCGALENAYGPFDYRTSPPDQRRLVENAHFTPAVETLRKGKTGAIGGDIDYTLRVFPNHPRALYAMTRLAERTGMSTPPGALYPVECYYDRAVRFQPDDARVRVLYGIFLIQRKLTSEARIQLERAEANAGDDNQVLYNLGLAYFELKDYKRAMEFADRAYAAGASLPGLRNKLQQVGK